MKVVIIEDEKPALDKIKQFLQMYDRNIELIKCIGSVSEGIEWFEKGIEIDLIIADIQLQDGTSFDIFKNVTTHHAIIFTTAYNEFAIDAFKLNSIDYLVKPIQFEDFYKSLEKIELLRENLPTPRRYLELEQLSEKLSLLKKDYKTRFMVKVGEHIRSFTTKNIQLFYAQGRDVSLLSNTNREFIIDNKLEDLVDLLNPKEFFRIGRSYIVNIEAIAEVIQYSNSRLKIILKENTEHELIVSRDKVNSFKEWFNGL